MPKKTGPKGKRNAQDTTLRNVRAAKKRDVECSDQLARLEDAVATVEWQIDALQDQIDALSKDRE